MIYKASMFNISARFEDKIVLYNSLKGKNSIKIFNNEDKIFQWLDEQKRYSYCNDARFQWLIDNGYLVKNEMNERAIRDARKAHLLEQQYLRLTIHVTQNCNFRCVYCANDFSINKMDINVQKMIIQYIKKNIHRFSGVFISWFGGEPLLEVHTIESMSKQIIEVCKRNRKPYNADITTNGYLLTEENIKCLLDCRVRQFCITVDGNEENHDRVRKLYNGGKTYQCIINNLKKMKLYFPNQNFEVAVRINLTKENFESFERYCKELKNILGEDKRFSIFIKFVRNWGGSSIEEIEDTLILEKEINDVYGKCLEKSNGLNVSGIFEMLEFGGFSCIAMRRNYLVVFVGGDIGKCEKEDYHNIVGRISNEGELILEDSFDSWNGIAYRMNDKCDNCAISPLCFGGVCPKDKLKNKYLDCVAEFMKLETILKYYAKMKVREEENEK